MAERDYTDLDKAQAREDTRRVIAPRRVSGFSLAALIVGILCFPAAVMPVIGIVVAMIGIGVGLAALIVANRKGTQRSYAAGGLVLAIIAMGVSIFFTQAALSALEGCEGLTGVEFTQCVENNQSK